MNMLWKYITITLTYLRNIIHIFSSPRGYIYKIEEIDECLGRITISCRGKGAVIITKIEDIVYDGYIIKELAPHHACWIGYYYGKFWQKNKNNGKKYKRNAVLSPNLDNSIYQITLQNREGAITYLHLNSGESVTMRPSELAHSAIISKFDSAQAYYIGFLSGLESMKDFRPSQDKKVTQPYLKIVK